MEELLRLEDLSKYYTSARSVVVGLDKLSLTFCRGEFVAVTGESGSGKSTLAHVLGGILPYESGELYLRGKPTSHYDSGDWENYRRDCVSFISQSYGILPGSTVMTNVVSALRLTGMDRSAARQEAESILRKVELWNMRGRRAAKLSSGQKQRLSIARALAKPASILIADEPTGNLDEENSAKVIALLAEAAKDRLVILITHEFSEAEGVATRHIAIHDGRVALDAPLREAEEVLAEENAGVPTRKRRGMGGYVAALQLRSRPVWTTLMLLLFGATVFAVFAFAGTFLSVWDDTNTRAYDDSAFPNGDYRRVVVARRDGENLTAEDEAALLALEHVEALERYSYLRDVKYAWREEVDYRVRYSLEYEGAKGESDYIQVSSVTLEQEDMAFARALPVFADGRDVIAAGRAPTSPFEVAAAGDESLLGETVTVFLHDEKHWNRSAYIRMDVTVVGVTDWGSGLYFHDSVGRIALANLWYGCTYVPAADLTGNELRLSEYLMDRMGVKEEGTPLSMYRLNGDGGAESLLCVGAHGHTYNQAYEVSVEMFDSIMPDEMGDQVSLVLEDYAYTDRVLDTLHGMGYAALSPRQEGATYPVASLAEQRQQTMRICVVAFLAVLALQVVVLRAMFALETESYRILSHIGLDCASARRSVFWQVLLFALCGQGVGLGAIFLCRELGISQVGKLLHYLTPGWGAGLSLLHLCACIITGIWTMKALQRQVYPNSASVPDLDWGSFEGEVRT